MKKAAIITANGIGDGMVMMIATNYLNKLGYHTTTFNSHLKGFQPWFDGFDSTNLKSSFVASDLENFDLILVQHDNSTRANSLVRLRNKKQSFYFFYTNYQPKKHGLLNPKFDFMFNEDQTMVSNIIQGLEYFFSKPASKDNGLTIPKDLTHRKYAKRVILHPSSGEEVRSWPKEKFIRLAKKLTLKGFDPIITINSQEKQAWKNHLQKNINLLSFFSLSDFCKFLFESGYFIGNDSGPAHIASCLQIPTLVLSKRRHIMKKWRPDWLPAVPIFPPRWVPNLKSFRIREYYWKQITTTERVLKNFIKLSETN